MIKTTKMLVSELSHYVNPSSKIRQLVLNKEIFQLVRGLYETNGNLPGHILSPIIYGQSYLSFEYVLSHYALIPEAVTAGSKMNLQMHGKEFFQTSVSTFF